MSKTRKADLDRPVIAPAIIDINKSESCPERPMCCQSLFEPTGSYAKLGHFNLWLFPHSGRRGAVMAVPAMTGLVR
jgi:hypothetical protein